MSAWIFQDPKQVEKHGEAKAAWSIGWYDPEGKRRCKSCGPGARGHSNAQKLRQKIEAELLTGTYGRDRERKAWADFREEYERRILEGLAARSKNEAMTALNHFERIVGPKKIAVLKTQHIDEYVSTRRKEPGKKQGDLVSPATVNKELRHVKAALRIAHEWGYLASVPRFRMEKAAKKLATYVTGDHFAAIYKSCECAKLPTNCPYTAAAWWRALITMGYMTGWRISDMLALRREDLDLQAGEAVTRGEDNKGKRDEKVKLHPVVLEHLKALANFSPRVFAWHHNRRTLQTEFAKIQEAAGIRLPCIGTHKHSRFCHVYGFHDLRRAFATMNADKLTPDALQALMRHRSYQTTQVYINMARQMDAAVASLHVPEVLRARDAS
jgi:integrase